MAYYNQDMKKAIQPSIKAVLAEYGMSGSLSIRNHSTVVLTLTAGPIDFGLDNTSDLFPGYAQVNVYWIAEHYTGVACEFLKKAYKILMAGNHNHNDVQTDYFDVGWYVDINIGRWNKPYVVTASKNQLTSQPTTARLETYSNTHNEGTQDARTNGTLVGHGRRW